MNGHNNSGERPFKCDICVAALTTARALKIHKRIHTDERPYKCDICESAFTEKGNLANHKQIHSGKP